MLGEILDRAGPLSAAFAVDGEPIRRGRVYVAPPDRHLLVRGSHVHLTRGPKENRTRPAVNPLSGPPPPPMASGWWVWS